MVGIVFSLQFGKGLCTLVRFSLGPVKQWNRPHVHSEIFVCLENGANLCLLKKSSWQSAFYRCLISSPEVTFLPTLHNLYSWDSFHFPRGEPWSEVGSSNIILYFFVVKQLFPFLHLTCYVLLKVIFS